MYNRYGEEYSFEPIRENVYRFVGNTKHCRFGGKEDTIDIYEYDLGPKIANMAQWDGGAIVDAIAFYTSMTIGRPLGQKIEKLVESKS